MPTMSGPAFFEVTMKDLQTLRLTPGEVIKKVADEVERAPVVVRGILNAAEHFEIRDLLARAAAPTTRPQTKRKIRDSFKGPKEG